jgi:2-C-methyl-D-erythritol 4-phosphate cytidylyltransferase
MTSSASAYAIIVAGGSGSRMGSAVPKQFLDLCGKPVLYWSMRAFLNAIPEIGIILVLPEAHLAEAESLCKLFAADSSITAVVGGDTRFASVAAGLAKVPPDAVVFVHDGARPLLSAPLIRRCYNNARQHGNAVPVIPVADSIRQISGDNSRAIMRENLRCVQTPQTFYARFLQEAFRQPFNPNFTDEASVMEWAGRRIHLVDGERSNLKITTSEDLIIAEALMKARETAVDL